jgi:hypothetical protein
MPARDEEGPRRLFPLRAARTKNFHFAYFFVFRLWHKPIRGAPAAAADGLISIGGVCKLPSAFTPANISCCARHDLWRRASPEGLISRHKSGIIYQVVLLELTSRSRAAAAAPPTHKRRTRRRDR